MARLPETFTRWSKNGSVVWVLRLKLNPRVLMSRALKWYVQFTPVFIALWWVEVTNPKRLFELPLARWYEKFPLNWFFVLSVWLTRELMLSWSFAPMIEV